MVFGSMRRVAPGIFVSFTALAACASSKQAAEPVPQSCSDGPLYQWDSPIPAEDAPAGYDINGSDPGDNPPRCTPHCGTGQRTAGVDVFPFEALPSGACTAEGALCSMRAKPVCPCKNDGGFPDLSGGHFKFYCRCESGAWRCAKINGSNVPAKGCALQPGTPQCTPASDVGDASTGG